MATGQSTPKSDGSRQIVRFAAFEFDRATGELRKHGLRIKIQGQPILVLTMLIDRSGDVVSREEIQEALWPSDTHVDFEHSLNAAIKRLRSALCDSADHPLYVETIPRRGYRFIAPLSYRDAAPASEVAEVTVTQPAVGAALAVVVKKKSTGWWIPFAIAAGALAAATTTFWWLQETEYFWRSPIANARYQTITDSDGVEQAAAISRDGRFVAFLSDRDGQTDVWVTQVGSGQFHNLTLGREKQLVNPSVRALGFSPDASFVTYWVRSGTASGDIGIRAVPTLGGDPKPYLEGAAELDWSRDGSRLVFHTPGPGDPMFVSDGARRPDDRPIFTAPPGLHSHYPLWSPDDAFIYFIQGALPDRMDLWRIAPAGGRSERITSHNWRLSHPVLLNRRTLLYVAADPDGSASWLYSVDVNRRTPHRLTSGLDRYTSLGASADGRRLVVTRAAAERTIWRLPLGDTGKGASEATRLSLRTNSAFAPRLGPNYLLYVSSTGLSESIWKVANGTGAELWSGPGAQILGAPAISPTGEKIAFSVRRHGGAFLYEMRADGSSARIVADSLDLRGSPGWAPDGLSVTSAADDHGVPRLFHIPLDNRPPARFLQEYSVDPAWSPDGRSLVFSGPDIGTTFPVKAAARDGAATAPILTLTRGARRMKFLDNGKSLVFLRGDLQHKNLWLLDLSTHAERQLTNVAPDFHIRDFDISPDGREVVLERSQERSDVVLIDLPPQ